ncbi:unnamed protein product [Rotaria sordida]|uniref:Glucose-methanol-choline oxidoreductase N-terminal domain-containing protein n=1 Tax=Rotaria sordida TaxID=392033 RepID=A0A814GFT7_9BILA|nr:unnamed protein product [Rotaria sordida]CAF1264199.1 unnamed protein product [Rotaria sordida]CAF3998457.1 unnamed protein product [Rotaria sordida]CAF4010901.1 unnamed protein product [Rotaria sordida]
MTVLYVRDRSKLSKYDGECDFFVVGLGAGGSVIAARLSEVPHWIVWAVDGGPSEDISSTNDRQGPSDKYPPYSFVSPHDPGIVSTPLLVANNKTMYIPRFNGLGGSTRLYGGIYARPSAQMMERWPSNWTLNHLNEYYQRIEDHYCYYYPSNVTDISEEDCLKYHGKNGPFQVNPTYPLEFADVSKLFKPYCTDTNQLWGGYNPDLNGQNHLGCSVVQVFNQRERLNRTNEQSPSEVRTSFRAYFNESVLERKNLRIHQATMVTQILFDGTKAVGVLIQSRTGTYKIQVKKEVILAGGTFATPHLLQVSGIGDPSVLSAAQIPLVAENYHVGRNLRDHVLISMTFQVKQANSTYPHTPNSTNQSHYIESIPNKDKSWLIHLNTGLRKDNITDLQIYFADSNYHWADHFVNLQPRECRFGSRGHEEQPSEFSLRMFLQDSTFLGNVTPISPNIRDKPIIDYNWKTITDYEYEVFNRSIQAIRRLVVTNTPWSNLIATEVYPGINTNLTDFINGHLESALHPITTCQMGLCCDTRLKVINVTNVRVSDASAFGHQVDANPSATIYVLAERLADIIREDYKDEIRKHAMLGTQAHASGATISYNIVRNMKDYSKYFPQGA